MNEYRVFNTIDSRWLTAAGPEDDIVISSRVRLARNSPQYPFPNAMTLQQERAFLTEVAAVKLNGKKSGVGELSFIDLSLVPKEERLVLVEKHLISPQLALSEGATGLLINEDETVAVMVNEEDHLRIQAILPGLSVEDSWELAGAVDDALAQKIAPAFHPRWGYLTACPTNTGTGLRSSVMLHLPALVWAGQAGRILGNLNEYGFTCRGLYGEGTECKGNLFQISNQVTMGLSEEDIIQRLLQIVMNIVERERDVRRTLMSRERIHVEDKVRRAEALLRGAVLLDIDEAFALLSDLRLGIDLGFLPQYEPKLFNLLIILMQPVLIEKLTRDKLNKTEMKQIRADLIRDKLQTETPQGGEKR